MAREARERDHLRAAGGVQLDLLLEDDAVLAVLHDGLALPHAAKALLAPDERNCRRIAIVEAAAARHRVHAEVFVLWHDVETAAAEIPRPVTAVGLLELAEEEARVVAIRGAELETELHHAVAGLHGQLLREHLAAVRHMLAALVDHAVGIVDPRAEGRDGKLSRLRSPGVGWLEVVVYGQYHVVADLGGRRALLDPDVAVLEGGGLGAFGIRRRRRNLDLDKALGRLLVVVSAGREEHARGVVVEIVLVAPRLEVERVLRAGHYALLRGLPPSKATVAINPHPVEVNGQILPGD